MAINLKRRITSYNFSSGNNVKYIVIHDTGNYDDSAWANANYFNGGNRSASAHYFVDEQETYQIVEDWNAAWHVGDGNGRYGITNFNSIGIEMCKTNGDIGTATVNRTIELTAQLMKKYNVPIDKVVRHYDASRKSCPNTWRLYNWARWWVFKEQLKNYIDGGETNMTEKQIKETIIKTVKEEIMPSLKGVGGEDFWAYPDLKKFNDVATKIGFEGFNETRLADCMTRGEFCRIMVDALEAIYNKLQK